MSYRETLTIQSAGGDMFTVHGDGWAAMLHAADVLTMLGRYGIGIVSARGVLRAAERGPFELEVSDPVS